MTHEKTNSHGGRRHGAGRPRLGASPRVSITFSVDPECVRQARVLRAGGVEVNHLVEKFISTLYVKFSKV